jgi:cbb3-type cytochrome oxidase subunit 3
MIRELVLATTPVQMAIAGIVAAVLVFIALIALTFRKSAKENFSRLARLPLLED